MPYLSATDKREFFLDLLAKLHTLVSEDQIEPQAAWTVAITVAKDHPDWPEEEAKPETAEAKAE